MLNTTTSHNTTVFNAPATGIIQKSNNLSYFIRFHYKSEAASIVFSDKPEYDRKPIVVLQTLLIADGWMLVEVVKAEDWK